VSRGCFGRRICALSGTRTGANVFVSAGSTTFGYGVPDDQTITSHLQEPLPPVGERTVRVYDFRHGSYCSTQERILFAKRTALGYVPDLGDFLGQCPKQGYPRMAEFVARNPLGVNFPWCADIQDNAAELL
jgi:hypothetical protein